MYVNLSINGNDDDDDEVFPRERRLSDPFQRVNIWSSGYDNSKCEQGINTVTPVITSNNVSEQTAPLQTQSDPDQQAMIAVWV